MRSDLNLSLIVILTDPLFNSHQTILLILLHPILQSIMSSSTSPPKSQPQSPQPDVGLSSSVVMKDGDKEDESTLPADPVTSPLSSPSSSSLPPLQSNPSPPNKDDATEGTDNTIQDIGKEKLDHFTDLCIPPEKALEIENHAEKGADAEDTTEKKWDLGGWSGELEVKAEPLDVDGLVRAPVTQFEKEYETFQEDIMSELYLLVLEYELWSKEYNQRLIREREEEMAQKTTSIRAKEQKQEKTRLSLLKFMNQVRSAMSALAEAIPQSPGSQLEVED